MASSLRLSAMRNLGRLSVPRAPRFINQRRWAQVHDVRFVATTRPSQAVLDKYREKLDQKAKSEGFGTIDDLKSAYSDKIKEAHKQDAIEFPIPQAPDTPVTQPNRGPLHPESGSPTPSEDSGVEIPQAPNTPVSQPNKDGPTPSTPGSVAAQAARVGKDKHPAIKGLDDIINVEKTRDLPERELAALWRLRHAKSPLNLCAVVPAATYKAMEDAAKMAPQFVLPVPHEGQGAEIHFIQWTFDKPSMTSTVLFTQLAEYRARGEFAQPHTTITHHLDLAEDRGLVMMQGQIVEGRGVQPDQAKWLVMCLQRFYGGWEGEGAELSGERKERAEERKKLLQWFANGDERFTVEKLMEEAERMG